MTTENTSTSTEAVSTEEAATSEVPAHDPDKWDDEPEIEEGEGDTKETKSAAKPNKKEEAAKEEKKQQEQRERRLRKLMIDGKEEIIDEEEAIKAYAKNKTADKRLKEAAYARKQLEAFHEQFSKDPLSVLKQKNLPINKRELAEQWLRESIEAEMKDPLEVELEEKNKKLRKYEEAIQRSKQAKDAQERQQKLNVRREELGKIFSEAMSSSVLSQDPETSADTLREMAMHMRLAKQNGDDIPTPEELATHVENKEIRKLHRLANTLTVEQFLGIVGEGFINKLRKHDLDQIRKQRGMSEETPRQDTGDSWDKPSRGSKEPKFVDAVTLREQGRKKLNLK